MNKVCTKSCPKWAFSTVASYRCSQLFEAVGLHRDAVDLCFKGVTTRIQGVNFDDFEQDLFKSVA
ncbi:hypothetical protein ACP76Z_02580 [Vibrio cholerae]